MEVEVIITVELGESLLMRYVRAPPLGPTPYDGLPLTSTVMACPWPFSFASVRARTQDHRDIIEMGSTLTTN